MLWLPIVQMQTGKQPPAGRRTLSFCKVNAANAAAATFAAATSTSAALFHISETKNMATSKRAGDEGSRTLRLSKLLSGASGVLHWKICGSSGSFCCSRECNSWC